MPLRRRATRMLVLGRSARAPEDDDESGGGGTGGRGGLAATLELHVGCLLYTSPSPRDAHES
eukprot:4833618-Prymnesium_polylepis.1